MEISIFIPSRSRANSPFAVSVKNLLKCCKERPIVVVPADQKKEYLDQMYGICDVLGCPVNGIGPTRQFIMENSPTQGVIMIDDDMQFYRRKSPDSWQLRDAFDFDLCIDEIKAKLEEYCHGGLSARQGNNRGPCGWVENNRVNNFHFFDRDVFLGEGCRFDAVPVMEDFFVTLTLLSLGYPNCVSYEWAWGQGSSGAPGGCSDYRTLEVQAEGAEGLRSRFPQFVTVVDKMTSGAGIFGQVRKDVRIQWKKAYCSKANERKMFHERD